MSYVIIMHEMLKHIIICKFIERSVLADSHNQFLTCILMLLYGTVLIICVYGNTCVQLCEPLVRY